MRRLRIAILLGLTVIALTGCDTERLNKLEKENTDLKAKINKTDVARDFDLQAKCGKDARIWFNENWSRDKDTILLDFTDHYNAKQNKCFILVEYHYNSKLADTRGTSWTNDMVLYDVYENAKYGEFGENHYTYFKPEIRNGDEVIICEMLEQKCKIMDEFKKLLGPYLND